MSVAREIITVVGSRVPNELFIVFGVGTQREEGRGPILLLKIRPWIRRATLHSLSFSTAYHRVCGVFQP